MVEQILKKQFVLGVGINDVNLDTAVEIVGEWLNGKGKHYIVTPNPEFIMAAQQDVEFRQVLNEADLAIPDGKGLQLSGKIKYTTTGIDLMERLCQISADQGFRIGFVGGKKGVALIAAERLRIRFPKLKIVFAEDGPEVDQAGRVINDLRLKNNDFEGGYSSIINHHSSIKIDILFVGFGHIKQEKWIAHNLDKLPVKVAIGVGGAFDYLSGKVMRAPGWIRKIGLEWLFRLILQPWRIKRQLVLAKFIWLVVFKRIF